MKTFAHTLGIIGAVTGALLCLSAGDARADKKLFCDMKGTWLASKDNFTFDAHYYVKDGPDYFEGVYTNTSANGAVAKILGKKQGRTWKITLIYTDPGHKGLMRELVGTGMKDANNKIHILGDYVATRNGRQEDKGPFLLEGKCR
jgi:hypothetical protein